MKTESQPKFTPGPWEFDGINMKIRGTGDHEKLTVIADVSPSMNFARGMGTQCANAALIAQASAMYAAMQEFLADIDDERFAHQPEAMFLKHYNAFRSILAAARGEANQSNPQQ